MEVSDENFILLGNNPKAVFTALWNHKLNNDDRARSDRKFALIIEGGGMRSIVSTGSVVALHKLGFSKTFNTVYGTSAGAISGAYFIAGQAPYGASLYYEHLNNKKFINRLKFPIFFDIDYLIEMMLTVKKLHVESILKSSTEFIVAATNLKTGRPYFFSSHNDIDIISAIKASCALPIYYDRPVKISDDFYLDGGVVTALPIIKAIEDGCTDIVVLMTRSKSFRRKAKLPSWFERYFLKKYGKEFLDAFAKSKANNRENIELVHTGATYASKQINFAAIAPIKDSLQYSTTDSEKLKTTYFESYRYTLDLLNSFKPTT